MRQELLSVGQRAYSHTIASEHDDGKGVVKKMVSSTIREFDSRSSNRVE